MFARPHVLRTMDLVFIFSSLGSQVMGSAAPLFNGNLRVGLGTALPFIDLKAVSPLLC